MYNLIIDVIRNTVYIELSGYLSFEQITEYIKELENLSHKFGSRIYSILIIANRLDPLSQDNLPYFQKAIEIALSWANKIAVVNGNRTITLMQMKRIETEARKTVNSETKIMRFKTKNDAFRYLYYEDHL